MPRIAGTHAIEAVRDTGWTHHIQRLMVICNHATIAGIHPHAVSHWSWAAFVDAYEWVELPNVVGHVRHGPNGPVGLEAEIRPDDDGVILEAGG